MANKKQLAILKQGVRAWNEWRNKNPDTMPDLSYANLSDADLSGANLSEADLTGALVDGVNFTGADLSRAILRAYLQFADLNAAKLSGADVKGAVVGWSRFSDVDLSEVKGLATVHHDGPSTIGIDTIFKSKGKIPKTFLRRCGIPDTMITYVHSLGGKDFKYYSCFISFSSKDQECAERLRTDLEGEGVRCYFAPKDMKTGDKIWQRIERAIKTYDKFLLILSENSIKSKGVEREVEAAFEKESPEHTVLFPIGLDDAAMKTNCAWAVKIRRERHITDFSRWKNRDAYQKAFTQLLRDLSRQRAQR